MECFVLLCRVGEGPVPTVLVTEVTIIISSPFLPSYFHGLFVIFDDFQMTSLKIIIILLLTHTQSHL